MDQIPDILSTDYGQAILPIDFPAYALLTSPIYFHTKEDIETAHCPTCFLRLEVGEQFVECACCNSFLKLVYRKSPAFEVIRLGTILETPAEKEERIRYEDEMSKISFHSQENGLAELIDIDISESSWGLRNIRFLDYLPIACGFGILGMIGLIFLSKSATDIAPVITSIIITPGLFLGVCVGYIQIGVINERTWNYYLFILPILLITIILLIIGTFLFIIDTLFILQKNISGLSEFISSIAILFYQGTFICVALISAQCLRKLRLSQLRLSLVELLVRLRSYRKNPPVHLKTGRRLNSMLGVFLIAVGVTVISACTLVSVIFGLPSIFDTVLLLPQTIGWFLLMRSRRYFQIDADSLLSADHRRPILFLRSFSDDQRLRFPDSFLRLIQKYLDFSLETRLANHFKYFGPFIAVGVSGETVPVRGAARAVLSHQEWIPKVSDWINEANVIVMYAGWTNWLSWELAKIIETGNISKLILIIPEVNGEARAIRAEHISLRIEHLKQVLKNTMWYKSLINLDNMEDIRAILFKDNGTIIAIRSELHNRDSYHLAALIAHYILMNPENIILKLAAE